MFSAQMLLAFLAMDVFVGLTMGLAVTFSFFPDMFWYKHWVMAFYETRTRRVLLGTAVVLLPLVVIMLVFLILIWDAFKGQTVLYDD